MHDYSHVFDILKKPNIHTAEEYTNNNPNIIHSLGHTKRIFGSCQLMVNWVIIIQYSSHYIKLPSTRMPHTNLNELSNFKQPDNANKFWCISKSRRTNPQYFFLNKYNERLKGLLVKEMEDMEEW